MNRVPALAEPGWSDVRLYALEVTGYCPAYWFRSWRVVVREPSVIVTSVVLPAAPVPLTLVMTGCDENAKSAKSIESAFAIPAIVPEKSCAVSRCSVPDLDSNVTASAVGTAKFQSGRLADLKLSARL